MKKLCLLIALLCTPILSFADPFETLWSETVTAYELYGNEKYLIQEEITQINHVLQAASLARLAGAPDPIVVALLFHDIGQVIKEENLGRIELLHSDHAEIGGEWLDRKGFPKSISDFVRNHALAKVVLCETEATYFASLSRASQISYFYQKQKYDQNRARVTTFMDHPLCAHYLAARKCDDMSKMIGLSIQKGNLSNFDSYRELAKSVYCQGQEKEWSVEWIKTVEKWHRQMIDSPESFEAMIMNLSAQIIARSNA